MLKPYTARTIGQAIERAQADGLQSVQQIRRAVRRRGTWFLTCEVPHARQGIRKRPLRMGRDLVGGAACQRHSVQLRQQ